MPAVLVIQVDLEHPGPRRHRKPSRNSMVTEPDFKAKHLAIRELNVRNPNLTEKRRGGGGGDGGGGKVVFEG